MTSSKLLFTFTAILGILVLTAQAIPVQPSTSPTPTPEQHRVTMQTYNAMVASIVHVQQTIWLLLRERSSPHNFINYTAAQAQRFEYCFLQDVGNPPSNNLTVRNHLPYSYYFSKGCRIILYFTCMHVHIIYYSFTD